MRVIAIIPARGGSKRLPRKNIVEFMGKPLIAHSIEACKNCKWISDIYVSSEDQEILQVASAHGAIPLERPTSLADDTTPKVIAIRQAVQDSKVGKLERNDIIAIVQANSPEMTADHLDLGFDLMLKKSLWEVMSADADGVQNAAFRLVRHHALFNDFLSAHCGFVIAPIADIHTQNDLETLEIKIKSNNQSGAGQSNP